MKYIKLQKYLDEQNRWDAFFGKPAVSISSLDQKSVDELASSIDCQLSPENLHCDGEISLAEANRKYKKLANAADDLFKFCDANKLTRPTIWEL